MIAVNSESGDGGASQAVAESRAEQRPSGSVSVIEPKENEEAVAVEHSGPAAPVVDGANRRATEPQGEQEPAPGQAPSGEPAPSAMPPVVVNGGEVAVSVLVMGLWLAFLTAGITVGTQPYLQLIRDRTAAHAWDVVGALFVILLCHTSPNIALLCCLSAFLGMLASRAVVSKEPGSEPDPLRMAAYVAAVTHGFFVYLVIQSGFVVFSDTAFTTTTLEQYVRLAALASLISFAVGYNPLLFQSLLARVAAVALNSQRSGRGA
jgi:hypothetical protein